MAKKELTMDEILQAMANMSDDDKKRIAKASGAKLAAEKEDVGKYDYEGLKKSMKSLYAYTNKDGKKEAILPCFAYVVIDRSDVPYLYIAMHANGSITDKRFPSVITDTDWSKDGKDDPYKAYHKFVEEGRKYGFSFGADGKGTRVDNVKCGLYKIGKYDEKKHRKALDACYDTYHRIVWNDKEVPAIH